MDRYEKRTPKHTFVLEVLHDGTLREYEPSNPEDAWGGAWSRELVSGEMPGWRLHLTIGKHRTVVHLDLVDGGYHGVEDGSVPIRLVPL